MTDSNTTPPEAPDEWADALAEQTIAEGADDDPWAIALAEQEAAEAPAPSVGASLFK
ncbi:flagellar motor switch protein FliN, partial [Pseudomonas kairouanensis]